jgi:NAD+ diphosphatase
MRCSKPTESDDVRPDAFFSGPGLDRADALRSDPEAIARLAGSESARCLIWREGLPAIGTDGLLEWGPADDSQLFLGFDDGIPRFSAVPERVEGAAAAFQIMGSLADSEAPLFAAAVSLGRWHGIHPHCARCGSRTDIIRGGWSRRCPVCEAEHYPRVDPVVMMLVEHDDNVLLGRQPHYPPRRYSALAGFLEVGETIEDAVRRELREEAGMEVERIDYVTSQPWPFPSSLMIGCTARALTTELTIDTNELDDARWFSRAEVEAALAGREDSAFQPPPRFAIARTLLEHWAERLEQGGTAP